MLEWPKGQELLIKTLNTDMKVGNNGISSVVSLHSGKKLEWQRSEKGLAISLPDEEPGRYAYVFKITPAGGLVK